MSKGRIGRAVLDALTGVPLFVTAPLFRRWHTRWGATDAEVAGPMPGDELVPKASSSTAIAFMRATASRPERLAAAAPIAAAAFI